MLEKLWSRDVGVKLGYQVKILEWGLWCNVLGMLCDTSNAGLRDRVG